MNKFKVGDRIKRVTPSNYGDYYGVVGQVYTVVEVDEYGAPRLKETGCVGAKGCFELVESAPDEIKVGDWVELMVPAHEVNKRLLPDGGKWYVQEVTGLGGLVFLGDHNANSPWHPVDFRKVPAPEVGEGIANFAIDTSGTIHRRKGYDSYIQIGVMPGLAPSTDACSHSWKLYEGFTARYHYCTKCDKKETQ